MFDRRPTRPVRPQRRGKRNEEGFKPPTPYYNSPPPELERLYEGGNIYISPDKPVDPRDCDRWPNSPWCGGNPLDMRGFGFDFEIYGDECHYCMRIWPTFGFIRMASFDACWVNPSCVIPEYDEGYNDEDLLDERDFPKPCFPKPPGIFDDSQIAVFMNYNMRSVRLDPRYDPVIITIDSQIARILPDSPLSALVSAKAFDSRTGAISNEFVIGFFPNNPPYRYYSGRILVTWPGGAGHVDITEPIMGTDGRAKHPSSSASIWVGRWRACYELAKLYSGSRSTPPNTNPNWGLIGGGSQQSWAYSVAAMYDDKGNDLYGGAVPCPVPEPKKPKKRRPPPKPPKPPKDCDCMSCCDALTDMMRRMMIQQRQQQNQPPDLSPILKILNEIANTIETKKYPLSIQSFGEDGELLVDKDGNPQQTQVLGLTSLVEELNNQRALKLLKQIANIIEVESYPLSIESFGEDGEPLVDKDGKPQQTQIVGLTSLVKESSNQKAFKLLGKIANAIEVENYPIKYQTVDENDTPIEIEIPGLTTLTKGIADLLGFKADFPIKVPASLILSGDKKEDEEAEKKLIKINTLPGYIHWFVREFDGIMGQWVIPIEVADTDMNTAGQQKSTIKIPNLAEAIGEIYGLAWKSYYNSEITLNSSTRSLIETGGTKQQLTKINAWVEAISDYLNFEVAEEKIKMGLLFTAGKTDFAEILKESEIDVPIHRFKGKKDFTLALNDLLHAAAVIRAVFWKKLDSKEDLKEQIISHVKSLINPVDDNDKEKQGDKDKTDFDVFLEEVEQGFINEPGVTDTVNPYGEPWDRRPKVRKIGEKKQDDNS